MWRAARGVVLGAKQALSKIKHRISRPGTAEVDKPAHDQSSIRVLNGKHIVGVQVIMSEHSAGAMGYNCAELAHKDGAQLGGKCSVCAHGNKLLKVKIDLPSREPCMGEYRIHNTMGGQRPITWHLQLMKRPQQRSGLPI